MAEQQIRTGSREIVCVYECAACKVRVRALAMPNASEPTVYGPCMCDGFRARQLGLDLDSLVAAGFVEDAPASGEGGVELIADEVPSELARGGS